MLSQFGTRAANRLVIIYFVQMLSYSFTEITNQYDTNFDSITSSKE